MCDLDVPSTEPLLKHVEEGDVVHQDAVSLRLPIHELDDEIAVNRPGDARQWTRREDLAPLHRSAHVGHCELRHDLIDHVLDSGHRPPIAPVTVLGHAPQNAPIPVARVALRQIWALGLVARRARPAFTCRAVLDTTVVEGPSNR
jgi:hypothetical protein